MSIAYVKQHIHKYFWPGWKCEDWWKRVFEVVAAEREREREALCRTSRLIQKQRGRLHPALLSVIYYSTGTQLHAFLRLYNQERTGVRQNNFSSQSLYTVPYQHIHNQFSHLPTNTPMFYIYKRTKAQDYIHFTKCNTINMLFNI